jgi:hypothetical protein
MPEYFESANGYFFQKNKNGKSKRISKDVYLKKNTLNQKGGAFPYPRGQGGKFTLLAIITGDTLIRVNQRRTAYRLQPYDSLHITLLEFNINLDHPAHDIFSDPNFHSTIKNYYRETILANSLNLNSVGANGRSGNWEILGGHGKTPEEQFKNKFWARVYTIPDAKQLEIFKIFKLGVIDFIKTILRARNLLGPTENLISRSERRGVSPDIEDFTTYSTKDRYGKFQELYCVNTNHYGNIINWKPHISVLKFGELSAMRPDIYSQIKPQVPPVDDAKIMQILRFNAPNVEPISNIVSNRDLRTLRISYNIGQTPANRVNNNTPF